MERYTIYIHINKINGKVYVGQTKQKPAYRWNNGDGYKKQKIFYAAIEQDGWDNFEHIIVVEGLTKELADEAERKLISDWKTNNDDYGYNIGEGGKYCGKPKGFKCTPEQIEINRQSHIGLHQSEQTKQIKSETSPKNKSVICVENGNIFRSAAFAYKQTGIRASHITECCRGTRQKAGGYHWRYVDNV